MTPLLFLHGVGGGHHAWEAQLPYFSSLGYPSHAWDQPGYGHSPMIEPYDLERVSASLARLIESVGEGEPVVLIGHSMGGLIAQETYVRHPELIRHLHCASPARPSPAAAATSRSSSSPRASARSTRAKRWRRSPRS
jgi:pimeloyl-ACP methyl ester carboxylesterase